MFFENVFLFAPILWNHSGLVPQSIYEFEAWRTRSSLWNPCILPHPIATSLSHHHIRGKTPPFYEMFLECIGEEGMVVVEGAPFARDSRRGTSRVGYADKAGGQEDGENANNSATVKNEEDSSDLTPQKRLTRRQMQEARTGDLSSKFSGILSVIETSAKLINDGANERFLAFQQASKESEERKLAEQRRQHDERMEELRLLLGRK